jgi:hypothetical protein
LPRGGGEGLNRQNLKFTHFKNQLVRLERSDCEIV